MRRDNKVLAIKTRYMVHVVMHAFIRVLSLLFVAVVYTLLTNFITLPRANISDNVDCLQAGSITQVWCSMRVVILVLLSLTITKFILFAIS